MKFDTFDQVAKRYNDTKPVVSTFHTLQDDVRPIGDRKRKSERIKKIDENTYALLDGVYGGTMWTSRGNYTAPDSAHKYENTMAPIVWMRREDGDYIRIRNHKKNCSSSARYNFLYAHAPNKMRMTHNNGKLSFKVQTGKWTDGVTRFAYEEFPLPKCNVAYDHRTKQMSRDDDTFLMFRVNVDGTFTRVGKLLYPTARIDKELKRSLKPHIAAFYEFCAAIAPMIDRSWGTLRGYREQLQSASAPGPAEGNFIPAELVRGIVVQEDHELRVALAAFVVSRRTRRETTNGGDLKNVKASYNRTMNTLLGLYTVEAK